MQPLRSVARSVARRPRALPWSARQQRRSQLHGDLLVRAFSVSSSSAADDDSNSNNSDWRHATATPASATAFAGTLSTGPPLRSSVMAEEEEEAEDVYDMDFTASRLGFSAYVDQGEHDPDEIREESRAAATAKAERILAILRHSMTELDIGRVIHRISQFATTPRVTHQTRTQFLKSLEARFGPAHAREHELVLAFLLGKDHVIEQLRQDSREAMDALANDAAPLSPSSSDELLVSEIMGLHPEVAADATFIGVVFCYSRMACLNSQKLLRPPQGQHRHPKSSLQQVKHDFRRVLDSEGLAHIAEMIGVKPELDADAAAALDEMASPTWDAEWDEFNLENDRIDFRMLVAQTQPLIALLKRELSDETITKMLIAMLASLKTSKLHRKIFQEMVSNIQAALPERVHDPVLRPLVPFLSGNQATYDDFASDAASVALQHHRSRHEAILRALLEARMRLGHILIHDLDAHDPLASISQRLPPALREEVVTAAWNIVSLLNDREYHVFFSRFLRHKLAWRPSRATFDQTFLDDVRKSLGPHKAAMIMPQFEKVYQHLSVETLTICRVKLRHAHKRPREAATLVPVDDRGRDRMETHWRPERCVFYRNLPLGAREQHLRASLEHIGKIKRFVLFSEPVDGPPDEIDEEEMEGDDAAVVDEEEEEEEGGFVDEEGEEEEEEEDVDLHHDDVEEEEEEEEVYALSLDPTDEEALKKHTTSVSRKKKSAHTRDLTMSKKKAFVIASNKRTPYHALVEFESAGAQQLALQKALQIFGVMMGGWNEYRPTFASPVDARTSVSVFNIPFGTTIASVLAEMQAVLTKHGLSVDLTASVPRGVMVTNGQLELRFASFSEASHVVELLSAHCASMKLRRELQDGDLMLEQARQRYIKTRQDEQKKELKMKEEKQKKKLSEEELEKLEKKAELLVKKLEQYDETPDAYFAGDVEDDAALSEDERARRAVPRPFDVSWTRAPRPKNYHMFV